MLPIPALVLGLIVSTFLGAAFHLWQGGGLGKLLLYLILGWLGFGLGQFLAVRLNLTFASFGALHLGPAITVELIFLWFGRWLSNIEPEPKSLTLRKK